MVDTPSSTTVRRGALVPPQPELSIIIPCFNVGDMAREAVQSALEQTVTNVEVIVVDDGSASPVADELQPLLERVILIRKPNGGLSSARNAGIRVAAGAYIVLLDGDDTLLPTHCEACLRVFRSDPECLAAAPDAWLFGEGQTENTKLSDLYPRREPLRFEDFLLGRSLVPGCCTFRKQAFSALPGPYDEGLARAEDFLLHAQLLARGAKYRFLTEPTYRYRKRAGSLSFDSPVPLARAVLQGLDKLEPECAAGSPQRKALVQARERYTTVLRFNLFREAVLQNRYHDALEHARSVRLQHLLPARRRWKFVASRAVVGVLGRVMPRG